MKFENTEVFNFKGALRGMRNPKNSWDRSDSSFESNNIYIGENDMRLAKALIHGGSEHRKFLRQIIVSVDITAPLYWWKEFDTYKIGTTANSTSTMHKITSKPITLDCFEIDDYEPYPEDRTKNTRLNMYWVEDMIKILENLRKTYLQCIEESKRTDMSEDYKTEKKRIAKVYWKELIRWLPESWLQTRTVTMNYENLLSMYRQRENHKLTEWNSFREWVETLPYSKEFITKKED